MRFELCVCAAIPHLSLPTRVVFLIAHRELRAPTNTGRLASQALHNSIILPHGLPDVRHSVAEHLMPEHETYVLYPDPEARVLLPDFVAQREQPINLIVPDGNWRQTVKMIRRDPFLRALPTVTLAPGPQSSYRVRHETKAGGLATIEAVARALGVLEGPAVQQALEGVFNLMVDRVMQSRQGGMGAATECSAAH